MVRTMSRHTPGPWMAQIAREETGFRMVRTYVLDGASGDPIAHVQANGMAEEEANARLIAAAPDLLDALRKAQSLLVELRAHELTDADDVEVMAAIEAVIVKATGL